MSSSAFARVPFCSAASSAPGAKGGEVLTGAFAYAAASKSLLFDGLKGKRHRSTDKTEKMDGTLRSQVTDVRSQLRCPFLLCLSRVG